MTSPEIGDLITHRWAAIEMATERMRQKMTLCSPVPTTVVPGIGFHPLMGGMTLRRCHKCDPPPRVFTCPVCDWETEDRWRMKMHNDSNPEWCRRRGRQKQRAWSARA